MKTTGHWHGKRVYFGLHYDLHAGPADTELGTRCGPGELAPLLRLSGADFVQTDCKGHPGYTSWFSKVPGATVSPGVKKDALAGWRAATRRLGVPLHCHYSGIWDKAAGQKHPRWCILRADGTRAGAALGEGAEKTRGEKMCPRGPYLEKLLIPQFLELIDRYGVDGFWVDGDLWAMEPCYCRRCRAAFTRRTGIRTPPTKPSDRRWPAWWNFTRESFEEYVTRYCDAVHAHQPGVVVCSNWLQSFAHPGEPRVPTDWISGDNAWVFGLDSSRCEARFLSTRGKPWDVMVWAFYCSNGMGQADSPWVMKPRAMLEQEAAVLASFGGNLQIYEHPMNLRNGQLVPWRMRVIGEVARFVKRRRALCQDATTIPQVAVLHSEQHLRTKPTGPHLMRDLDLLPARGAVYALLECHYGVDVLDEWALRPRLREFPVVVVPEQDRMSGALVKELREYVRGGGRLLVTGAGMWPRFGGEFLGVNAGRVERQKTYYVAAGQGAVPLASAAWRLVSCTTARALGRLGRCDLRDQRLLRHPAATIHRVGRGRVAYIPAAVFHDFGHNRYPRTREFIREVMRELAGRLAVTVDAPTCVDVVLRRKGNRRIVHLVNRSSGIPNQPHNGAIDEIPVVGPVTARLRLVRRPRAVRLAFERGPLAWRYRRGELTVRVATVRLHAAVVVEEEGPES